MTAWDDRVGALFEAEIIEKAEPETEKTIRTAYNKGVLRAESMLKSIGVKAGLGIGVETDEAAIDILQQRAGLQIDGLTKAIRQKLVFQITEGMRLGEPAEEIAKRLSGEIDSMGIERARVIARTEVMTAFNTATVDRFERHGIKKIEWFAAYDERVCTNFEINFGGETYYGCDGINGAVFDVDDHPPIPAHPNCRCVYLPVFEEGD